MAISPAQLQKYLSGVEYPCSKDDLVQHARENGADEDAIDTLRGMAGNSFQSPADVSKALGSQ